MMIFAQPHQVERVIDHRQRRRHQEGPNRTNMTDINPTIATNQAYLGHLQDFVDLPSDTSNLCMDLVECCAPNVSQISQAFQPMESVGLRDGLWFTGVAVDTTGCTDESLAVRGSTRAPSLFPFGGDAILETDVARPAAKMVRVAGLLGLGPLDHSPANRARKFGSSDLRSMLTVPTAKQAPRFFTERVHEASTGPCERVAAAVAVKRHDLQVSVPLDQGGF